jgi:hypothetical protein
MYTHLRELPVISLDRYSAANAKHTDMACVLDDVTCAATTTEFAEGDSSRG